MKNDDDIKAKVRGDALEYMRQNNLKDATLEKFLDVSPGQTVKESDPPPDEIIDDECKIINADVVESSAYYMIVWPSKARDSEMTFMLVDEKEKAEGAIKEAEADCDFAPIVVKSDSKMSPVPFSVVRKYSL